MRSRIFLNMKVQLNIDIEVLYAAARGEPVSSMGEAGTSCCCSMASFTMQYQIVFGPIARLVSIIELPLLGFLLASLSYPSSALSQTSLFLGHSMSALSTSLYLAALKQGALPSALIPRSLPSLLLTSVMKHSFLSRCRCCL